MVPPSLGPAPVAGAIPVLETDSLVISYRTVQSSGTGVAFNIRYMDPNGQFQTYRTPAFAVSTTTWALTTGMALRQLGFSGWVTNIALASGSGSITAVPGGLYLEFAFGTSVATSNAYAVISKNTQSAVGFEWKAGDKNDSPFFSPGSPGKLYTFQGTVANGAGGAGDNSLTIAAATASRFEVLSLTMFNGDTSARNGTLSILDAAGGNTIASYLQTASLGLNTSRFFPYNNASADNAGSSGHQGIVVAGANVLVATIAAVAASENTAFSALLRVWGAAPTFTLAGASTPTLTTNTSRFEPG